MPVILGVSLSISMGVPSQALAAVKVTYIIRSNPHYNDDGIWWETVRLYGAATPQGKYVLISGSEMRGPQQLYTGHNLQFTRHLDATFPVTLFRQAPGQTVRPEYYAMVKAIASATPSMIQSVTFESNLVQIVPPAPIATRRS